MTRPLVGEWSKHECGYFAHNYERSRNDNRKHNCDECNLKCALLCLLKVELINLFASSHCLEVEKRELCAALLFLCLSALGQRQLLDLNPSLH